MGDKEILFLYATMVSIEQENLWEQQVAGV